MDAEGSPIGFIMTSCPRSKLFCSRVRFKLVKVVKLYSCSLHFHDVTSTKNVRCTFTNQQDKRPHPMIDPYNDKNFISRQLPALMTCRLFSHAKSTEILFISLLYRFTVLIRRFCKCSVAVKCVLPVFKSFCLCLYDAALLSK
jgi:hypothetical protein